MSRVAPPSAPGSLLKGVTPTKKAKKEKLGRSPRVRDDEHLACVRQCSCVCCGIDPAGEAAHIRLTVAGKPISGIGNKPDDKFVTPLCRNCHSEQHRVGESSFWSDVGIDPLRLAETLYRLSPNVEAMRAAVFVAYGIAKTNDGEP